MIAAGVCTIVRALALQKFPERISFYLFYV